MFTGANTVAGVVRNDQWYDLSAISQGGNNGYSSKPPVTAPTPTILHNFKP